MPPGPCPNGPRPYGELCEPYTALNGGKQTLEGGLVHLRNGKIRSKAV